MFIYSKVDLLKKNCDVVRNSYDSSTIYFTAIIAFSIASRINDLYRKCLFPILMS